MPALPTVITSLRHCERSEDNRRQLTPSRTPSNLFEWLRREGRSMKGKPSAEPLASYAEARTDERSRSRGCLQTMPCKEEENAVKEEKPAPAGLIQKTCHYLCRLSPRFARPACSPSIKPIETVIPREPQATRNLPCTVLPTSHLAQPAGFRRRKKQFLPVTKKNRSIPR